MNWETAVQALRCAADLCSTKSRSCLTDAAVWLDFSFSEATEWAFRVDVNILWDLKTCMSLLDEDKRHALLEAAQRIEEEWG